MKKDNLNERLAFDIQIFNTQEYLNNTYSGRFGWVELETNGYTGWPTIRGLIRALQIELGLTPDGSFGAGTESRCPTLSKNLNPSESTVRLVKILHGAMWCKGFSPGYSDGIFDDVTESGVIRFQNAAGLSGSNVNGVVNPMIFKALLNMDAFVLVSSGDSKIRQIQQELNRDYHKWIGLRPTDGRYGRDTCKALIYALQVEGGIDEPNGTFGPATIASLPTLSPGSKNAVYVRIMQYCLYCNTFDPTGFTGVFGNGTLAALKKFQSFHALVADGYCGKQTWMSLLLSHGDRDRKGEAFDCATPLNQARINTLKSNGFKYAGRYIAGGESKKITIPEIELILENGMKWFPIFQKSGNYLGYFNSEQGVSDAKECLENARKYKIPKGSTIYFAVDFDAMDGEVTSNVIPYFRSINNIFRTQNPSRYKIGVYGARNICSRVSNAGYATTSFVGDLASGFSGNLGYPLPKNWAFDQIKEYTIGSGSGSIAIDKNIYSGRDLCIESMNSLKAEDVLTSLFDALGLSYDVPSVNSEYTDRKGDFIVKYNTGMALNAGSTNFYLEIKDGKFEEDLFNQILSKFDVSWMPITGQIKDYLNGVLGAVVDGNVTAFVTNDSKFGPGLNIKLNMSATRPDLEGILDIGHLLYASIGFFPDYDNAFNEFIAVLDEVVDVGIVAVACIIVVGLLGGVLTGAIGVGIPAVESFIATLTAILGFFK